MHRFLAPCALCLRVWHPRDTRLPTGRQPTVAVAGGRRRSALRFCGCHSPLLPPAGLCARSYATQRSDSAHNTYSSVVLTRKDGAGQGYFDYYSSNVTAGPFNMHAPSPAGFVVNEYLVPPVPTPFAADAPEFALPAGIPCINTTLAAALAHPGGFNAHLAEALRSPGFRLAMPELYMSGEFQAAARRLALQ